MSTIITFAFGMFFIVSINMALGPLFSENTSIRNQLIARTIGEYQIASQRRYFENRNSQFWGDDFNAIGAGYEYLTTQPYFNQIERFEAAGAVSKDGFRFSRIVMVYSLNRNLKGSDGHTITLMDSVCGGGSIITASKYCPQNDVMWSSLDADAYYDDILEGESARIKKTITKFYRNYGVAEQFTGISAGTIDTVARLSGYNGTAQSCEGIYMLDGSIPITCDDMFNWWGTPITLNIVGSKKIYLINTTSIIRSGKNVIIGEEASLE
tara:strand:+ start:715 stop:1515 length:801 start_codon:yes stop_codon:yes gene_type:complete